MNPHFILNQFNELLMQEVNNRMPQSKSVFIFYYYCHQLCVIFYHISHITGLEMTSCCFEILKKRYIYIYIYYDFPISHTDEALPFHEVLVGVLSARHHYELRQAIRQTWLGYLRDHPHFQQRSVGWSSNFTTRFFPSLACFLSRFKATLIQWK